MRIFHLAMMVVALRLHLAQSPLYVDEYYVCYGSSLLSSVEATCECIKETNLLPSLIYAKQYYIIKIKINNFTADRLAATNRVMEGQIESLNMDNNYLRTIDPNAFYSMRILRLSITNNYLTELSLGLLGNISTLTMLELEYNLITSISFGFFDSMPVMKEIKLGNNLIGSLDDFLFSKLSRLERLNFRSNYIAVVTSRTFAGLNSLDRLDLSENFITSIDPFAFHSSKLSYLFLANNVLTDLEKNVIPPTSRLSQISILANNLKHIYTESFSNLSIDSLDLSNQRILFIDDEAFKDLVLLKVINMESNQIKTFRSGWFSNLRALIELNLNLNLIERLEIDTRLRINYLKLQSNYLNDLAHEAFVNLPDLTDLDLSYNFLTEKSLKSLNTLSNLAVLNLDSNKLFDFKSDELFGLKRLESLYLKKNSIWELHADSFKNLISLTYLDLSYNKLETIEKGTFNGLTRLSMLYLPYNKIKELNADSLAGLNMLNELNLEGNLISWIESNTFKTLKILSSLNLKSNRISALSFLSSCSNLVNLNLAFNNIIQIRVNSLSSLVKLETLELENNRLVRIEWGSFSKLVKLVSLGLRNTIEMSIETFDFYSISRRLTRLDLSQNLNAVNDSQKLFGSLNSIKTLELSAMNLTEYFFKWLPTAVRSKVQKLDLSNNYFKYDSQNLQLLSTFTDLSELNMNSVGLLDLDTIQLVNIKLLQTLHLRNNSLRVLKDKAFMSASLSTCFLESLDLSMNKIELIEFNAFYCLRVLAFLNMSHNRLDHQKEFNLSYFEKLKIFDASHCSLSFLPSFEFVNRLQNLVLSYNKIEFFKDSQFYYLNSLSHLDLSYNRIRFLELEYGPDVFNGLSMLKTLNLSHNQIDGNMTKAMHLDTLTQVKYLNLSSNKIVRLTSDTLDGLEKLIDLDLSNNQLVSLHSNSLHYLTNLKNVYLNKQNSNDENRVIIFSPGFANGTNTIKFIYLNSTNDAKVNLASFLDLEPAVSKKEIVLSESTTIKYYESVNLVTDDQPKDLNYCWLTLTLIKSKIFLNLSRDKDVENFLSDCHFIDYNSPQFM